jgi:hypothetical protein
MARMASAVYLKSRPMKALHFSLHEIGRGFLPQFQHGFTTAAHLELSYGRKQRHRPGDKLRSAPHTAQPLFEDPTLYDQAHATAVTQAQSQAAFGDRNRCA